MRFELTVALKYLIPRWRQLSVSIISLISVLVISLVVWLVLIFLSVTEGMEKKWVRELVALNAPIKLMPTDAYYHSYFHLIDNYSLESNYQEKSIGEKLASLTSDPYDPDLDSELPIDFPKPLKGSNGQLLDPVKEVWQIASSLKEFGAKAQEYEVTFGNLRLSLLRENKETYLSQISYVASLDEENSYLEKSLVEPKAEDYQNLLDMLDSEDSFSLSETGKSFFNSLSVKKLTTNEKGFFLSRTLYPESGKASCAALFQGGEIVRAYLPKEKSDLKKLIQELKFLGQNIEPIEVEFVKGQPVCDNKDLSKTKFFLANNISFDAKQVQGSAAKAQSIKSLPFLISGKVQNLSISGVASLGDLSISEFSTSEKTENSASFWISKYEGKCQMPKSNFLGEGVLVSKHMRENGVLLGDRGFISYYSPSATSVQEQRVNIYVAGFYDPGMLPIGNKLLFVDPSVTSILRGNFTVSDQMLGNGINIWLSDISKTQKIKEKIVESLEERGISEFWRIQSFDEYEFSKPILQQLKSDKNIFTLIAIIILVVACSNIISMLILLVNDKKKEIGILQSMGASPRRIGTIFGICGFTMGLLSSVFGTAAALLTLKYLHSLINFLSFVQGHDIFQSAFYGKQLPNEISMRALFFCTLATLVISLLAGIIPAIKAARIRPSEILKAQ